MTTANDLMEMRQLTAKDLGKAVQDSGVAQTTSANLTASDMLMLARHLAAIGCGVDIAQMQGPLEQFQPYYQKVLEQAADEGYVDETDEGWTFTLAVPLKTKFINEGTIEEVNVRRPMVEELRDNPAIKDPYKQGVARLRKLSGMKPQDIDNLGMGDWNLIMATLTGYVEMVLGRHRV